MMMVMEDVSVTAAEHAEIKELIVMVRTEVEELRRAIRGHNGYKGLQTRIELLEQRSESEKQFLDAALVRIQAATDKLSAMSEPVKKATFGTWEWFRDGIGAQIVTVVITVVVLKLVDVIVTHWNILP